MTNFHRTMLATLIVSEGIATRQPDNILGLLAFITGAVAFFCLVAVNK